MPTHGNTETASAVAEFCKSVRGDLGMTQAAFARSLGITQPLVSWYEAGSVTPEVGRILELAAASSFSREFSAGAWDVRVSPGYLLAREERFSVPDGLLEGLAEMFRSQYPNIRKAAIYGSRAAATARKYSDVDLVVWCGGNGDHGDLYLDVLPRSRWPYRFDVFDADLATAGDGFATEAVSGASVFYDGGKYLVPRIPTTYASGKPRSAWRLDNLREAFEDLGRALEADRTLPVSEAFHACFDLSWKYCADLLSEAGFPQALRAPLSVFRAAGAAGALEDAGEWRRWARMRTADRFAAFGSPAVRRAVAAGFVPLVAGVISSPGVKARPDAPTAPSAPARATGGRIASPVDAIAAVERLSSWLASEGVPTAGKGLAGVVKDAAAAGAIREAEALHAAALSLDFSPGADPVADPALLAASISSILVS